MKNGDKNKNVASIILFSVIYFVPRQKAPMISPWRHTSLTVITSRVKARQRYPRPASHLELLFLKFLNSVLITITTNTRSQWRRCAPFQGR